MINIILIVIIALIFFMAVKSAIKHFKGEGSCCGGGGTTIVEKKKLDSPAVEKTEVLIEGMKCSECANRVWNSLDRINGLAVTKVNFKNGSALFDSSRHISEEELKSAIEASGYKLIRIIQQ